MTRFPMSSLGDSHEDILSLCFLWAENRMRHVAVHRYSSRDIKSVTGIR